MIETDRRTFLAMTAAALVPYSALAKADVPKSYAVTRPAYIGQYQLMVRDLAMVQSYYQMVLGLAVLEQSANGVTLGVDGNPLLVLVQDKNSVLAPRSAPGLFHTAFLMPNRQELGRFLVNVAALNAPLVGAADHIVSEAIYLEDPEGNGIEVYADRPAETWVFDAKGQVKMGTEEFDLQALYDATLKDAWQGMVPGSVIGHIHLQVNSIPQADTFFEQVIGMQRTADIGAANFFSTGKYHHHVGANVWNSNGAPLRAPGMTGLVDYHLHFNDKAAYGDLLTRLDTLSIKVDRDGDKATFVDPWGTRVKLVS
jgi:catechol 2,3-dioxygenase